MLRTLAGSGVSFTWLPITGGEGGELVAQALSISPASSASKRVVVQLLCILVFFQLLQGSVLGLQATHGQSMVKGEPCPLGCLCGACSNLGRQGRVTAVHAHLLDADRD